MFRFLLYLLRWQLSTPILALCIVWFDFGAVVNCIIANLVGDAYFFGSTGGYSMELNNDV